MSEEMAAHRILSTLRELFPADKEFIGLHEPIFEGNEWNYVKTCLDTGWVSSVGEYVDRFEEVLAEFCGVKCAVAVVNGTAALQVALRLAGVQVGEEVLAPSLTFVATANAISYLGAVPHFVDCEERTLGLDSARLASYLAEIADVSGDGCYNRHTSRRIRAVVPMHTFGHPVDIDPLVELCSRFGLVLVEDAAESLGSLYRGRHTGTFGLFGVLSFNGNKTITTGGGGAILTNDEMLGALAKHLTTTAKLPHRWEFNHDLIGYNFRMPNLNAALGCAQMEQLEQRLFRKRALALRYREAFNGIDGVRFVTEPTFAKSNYWLNALLLNESCASMRDEILELTAANGIMTRPAWTPMHLLPMYAHCPRMALPVTESLRQRLINIPSNTFW